ncbi:hypothetical protein GGE65_006256 [Skermanella aerolata]|uniref:hypothetical protein n=1 Tax=Skermanella aerolata TaxID=393310 RepID=UPI003D1A1F6F
MGELLDAGAAGDVLIDAAALRALAIDASQHRRSQRARNTLAFHTLVSDACEAVMDARANDRSGRNGLDIVRIVADSVLPYHNIGDMLYTLARQPDILTGDGSAESVEKAKALRETLRSLITAAIADTASGSFAAGRRIAEYED